jgi:hypothetical protein
MVGNDIRRPRGAFPFAGAPCRMAVKADGTSLAAGGQAGDIDAAPIDGELFHDLAGDAGDQRRFPAIAALVVRAIPVPAFRHVRRLSLAGIGDEDVLFLSQRVHLRSRGEVVGRLRTAMHHHHQGQALPSIAARHIELVGAGSGLIREAAFLEAGTRRGWRHDGCFDRRAAAEKIGELGKSRHLEEAWTGRRRRLFRSAPVQQRHGFAQPTPARQTRDFLHVDLLEETHETIFQ